MTLMRLAMTLLPLAALLLPATSTTAAPDPIQPGDEVTVAGENCTLNFVYDGLNSKKGKVYVGTAAHCVTGVGDWASTPGNPNFGQVAYMGDHDDTDVNGIAGIQQDFALIEVKAAFVPLVKAEVLGHPGLPLGYTKPADTDVGDRIMLSGYGTGFELSATTREERVGVLTFDSTTTYRVYSPIVPGDSGGPILHNSGKALGIVNHIAVACCPSGGVLVYDEGVTVQGALAEAGSLGFPLKLRYP